MQIRVRADRVPELRLEALGGGDLERACAIRLEAVGTRGSHGHVSGAKRGPGLELGWGLASGLDPALHDRGGQVRPGTPPAKVGETL